MENEIKILIETFFEKFTLPMESINIDISENKNISIKIKTPDSALFIWSHGKNLEAFELVLKTMLSRKQEEKIRLHIEINDYINSRDNRLFSMIKEKIALLKKWNSDIKLSELNAYERKKVHSFVADLKDDTIYTKSIWEWTERRLYICKLSPKMTIDIDWDDI